MRPVSIALTSAAFAVALALSGAGAASAQAAGATAAAAPPPVTAEDRVLGRADAPVTVIEYASFVCDHCAAWHNEVFPQFKARFIDTGKVKLVFRNLPTEPADAAFAAAAVARCAAPERYFDVASSFFAGQSALFAGQGRKWFNDAVAVSGRTQAEIAACFDRPETQARLTADVAGATAAGARSTPTFFVNGRKAADQSLQTLTAAIEAAQ